jgi:hypothetical protein
MVFVLEKQSVEHQKVPIRWFRRIHHLVVSVELFPGVTAMGVRQGRDHWGQ